MRRSGKLMVEMYERQATALTQRRWREYELALHGLEHVAAACAAELEGTDVNSPLGDGVQLITSGPRLARAHGSASARQIASDDVVMMDFCRVPYLLGYRMAMGRVVSLRKLTSEEQDIDAAIDKSYRAAMAMCRPGASCSDIDSTIRAILVKAGLAPHIVHRNGRGVGIEAVELPEIKEGTSRPAQKGDGDQHRAEHLPRGLCRAHREHPARDRRRSRAAHACSGRHPRAGAIKLFA